MTVVLRVGRGVEGLDELTPELLDWATVSSALGATTGEARTIVRLRGEQLAAKYAEQLQMEVVVIDDTDVDVLEVADPVEPTPWATGLALAGVAVVVVFVGLVALSEGLWAINPLLAVAANLLVVGGLAPSVWQCRALLVWRWVALGATVGVVAAWGALLLSTLG